VLSAAEGREAVLGPLGGGSVGDPVSGDAAGAAEEGGCGGSSDSCLFDVCS